MEKVQLNFTKRAARSFNTEATLLSTTTELYDLYTHTEDMSLFIQIVGDDENDTPDLYIDDVTLKDLHYVLSQLNTTALKHCIIWLRDYDGKVLKEFAVVCDAPHNDFAVNNCNFRLCDLTVWGNDISVPLDNIVVIHEEEAAEIYYKIMNIIDNN